MAIWRRSKVEASGTLPDPSDQAPSTYVATTAAFPGADETSATIGYEADATHAQALAGEDAPASTGPESSGSEEWSADESDEDAPKSRIGGGEDGPAPVHIDTRNRPVRPLPRLIAVANQKGGVGKTTTTVNLGAALATFGYRVLVVDLDPQGNATTGLGVDARGFQQSMYDVLLNDTPMVDCIEPVGIENLFVAPATLDLAGVEQELFSALSRELRLKRALDTVVDDYDFIFVDCPPSLGLITINAFAAATEILVPVQCEYYALEGLTQLQRIVTLVQRNLNESLEISTVVLTMYDARTRLSEDVANEVRRHFPDQVQGTVIPRTVRLSEAPSFGQPITTFDPASKGARAYRALAREVSNGAEKRAG
jgi:chromosome partitioning protein